MGGSDTLGEAMIHVTKRHQRADPDLAGQAVPHQAGVDSNLMGRLQTAPSLAASLMETLEVKTDAVQKAKGYNSRIK